MYRDLTNLIKDKKYQVRSCPYCTYSLDLKLNKEDMKKLKDWYKDE